MVSIQELVNSQVCRINLELHVAITMIKHGRVPSSVRYINVMTKLILTWVACESCRGGGVTLWASQEAHMLVI